ncbi:MAG TPA: 16S rRNA (uracil(1498)-N(3))-methyltransferase [bacterium]|mgnify:CR=1 FL=1|nr:16S rRNA (uracil(1498)-N(3))-methyltransferase [bacterium]
MHWESVFAPPECFRNDEVTIPAEESRHLRALRKKRGDEIWVIDGKGGAFRVRLLDTGQETMGKVMESRRLLGEPRARVTLAPALIRGERFDWLIEKAVELGVSRLLPVITQRTERAAGPQKWRRWQRIALAAMKQSGRSVLPEIMDPRPFERVILMGADCTLRLIAHDAGDTGWSAKTGSRNPAYRALAMVGPEGGFSEEEIAMAVEHGFRPVSLGPRRLRAETAALVIITRILRDWNELG